jgi:putative transposase
MKIPKQEYTAEFKELTVKWVKEGLTPGAAAKELGLNEQTLRNWIKAAEAGKLNGPGTKPVTPEQRNSQDCGWRTSGSSGERCFNSLKNERVHGRRYATRAEATADIFEYIEVFYNRKRRHSTLGFRSPTQFMKDWLSAQHDEKLVA